MTRLKAVYVAATVMTCVIAAAVVASIVVLVFE